MRGSVSEPETLGPVPGESLPESNKEASRGGAGSLRLHSGRAGWEPAQGDVGLPRKGRAEPFGGDGGPLRHRVWARWPGGLRRAACPERSECSPGRWPCRSLQAQRTGSPAEGARKGLGVDGCKDRV